MRANVVRKGTFSSLFCVSSSRYSTHVNHRKVIAAKNPAINAFVHVSEPLSTSTPNDLPLSGLTVAVKDNIVTSRLPTTCSSAMLQNFTSPFDATVVELLEKNGADIIGKTNCDEFGMGSLNVYSVHGSVKNPIGLLQDPVEERSAGGSSGGSAAAVAAGMCDAALGTDTGGSVRLPASYCGIVGLKPSYGLISRWGVVSYADSLDCVGILASDIDTTRRVFERVATYDSKDPTSAPQDIRNKAREDVEGVFSLSSDKILDGLKIGVPQEYFPSEMSPAIVEHLRNLIALLRSQGATVIPISLPSTSYALSSYYVLASAEASSNLARYDGVQYGSYVAPAPDTDLTQASKVYARTRSSNFGKEVQKRILLGTYALSAEAFDNYFLQAQRVRQLIKNDFDHVFSIPNHFSNSVMPVSKDNKSGVDILLHPSAIRTAPLLTKNSGDDSSLSPYVQDVLTVPASLGGLPALSIPIKASQKVNDEMVRWPVGASIVGQWGTDELVLSVAKAIEVLQCQ